MPPETLSLLILGARRPGEFGRLDHYLKDRFPRSQRVYILPDEIACNFRDPNATVFSYPKGPLSTYFLKGRVLGALLGQRFHYCIFPFDFSSYRQYSKLFLLLLFVRVPCLLVLGEAGRARSYRKTQWVWILAKAAGLGILRRIQEKIRLRDWLDIPFFVLLVLFSRFRYRISGILARLSRTRNERPRSEQALPVSPRVVHFISALCIGGAQRQLHTLVVRQCRKGARPTVVVLDDNQAFYTSHFTELSIDPIYLIERNADEHPRTLVRFFSRAFPYCTAALRLSSLLRRDGGTEILHCWLFASNIIGAVAGRMAGIPVVLSSERNVSHWKRIWFGRWAQWVERLTAPMNDRVIVNAEVLKDDFAKWSGLHQNRIVTIYNGIDPQSLPLAEPSMSSEIREEMSVDEGKTLIGWVGRLETEKDPSFLLRAARMILDQQGNVSFLVLGSGKLEKQFSDEVDRLGLQKEIIYLGERKDVYRLMLGMDLLWLTSIVEGMPNVLIEAQLLGIPCVTTDAGGAREVVENARSGFVVPVGDMEAFVEKTRILLEDLSIRARFSATGRQRANDLFHADRMVEETQELYRSLLSAGAFVRNLGG